MPARSPIFITPSHSAITPVRPSAISNAALLLSNSAFTSAAKTSASPRKTSLNNAIRKAARKKPTHNALSMEPYATQPAMTINSPATSQITSPRQIMLTALSM